MQQAKESWEMSSAEKLEQSNIVKERGTAYFKVSHRQGAPGRADTPGRADQMTLRPSVDFP